MTLKKQKMIKMTKTCRVRMIVVCMFMLSIMAQTSSLSAEQIQGEIINVNSHYKIAFTDLSNQFLRVGDVVEIRDGETLVTHLLVSEATTAISKLVPVEDKGGFSDKVDFTQIHIGQKVLKVNTSQSSSATTKPNLQTTEVILTNLTSIEEFPEVAQENSSDYKKLHKKYVELSVNLAGLINNKKDLETEVQSLKVELNEAQDRLSHLESENGLLENKVMELSYIEKTANKSKSKKEVVQLKKTIFRLKKKLTRMADLVAQKGFTNEE